MRKTIVRMLFVLAMVLAVVPSCAANYAAAPVGKADYYVAANGSDRGKGTQSAPWRSVNKALSSVPHNQGKTILVGAGTFDLGGEVSVPSGVHLKGSGVNRTTIQGGLKILQTKNVTIDQLKLDGKRQAYRLALWILNADRLSLHDLVITGYREDALSIERAKNGEIYNIAMTDNSYNRWVAGGGGKQTATMTIANLTDFVIHDLTIDSRARGGSGIVSYSDQWGKDRPWEGPNSILKNVKFYNLDIKVDRWHAYGGGSTPQLTLELWHQTCHNCEISQSTFNSTISLVTNDTSKIRVHHNLWSSSDNPFYACEADSDNLEFDHNYVRGGSYPIAMFGEGKKNLTVHHNIFEKTGAPTLVGHFLNRMPNFKFYNNTVYADSKTRLFYFEKGETPDQEIRNNIFYSSVGNAGDVLNAKVGVRNNLFYNIKPVGMNAMSFDPQLARSGNQPILYFQPKNKRVTDLGAIKTDTPGQTIGK
ncbi:hypothetical protein [Phormidesmis priestleyi]